MKTERKIELLDRVIAHFEKQGCKAIDHSMLQCMYRTPDGQSCAVGCLIPDEVYDPKIEGIGMFAPNADDDDIAKFTSVLKNSGICVEDAEEMRFLKDVQSIHDQVLAPFKEMMSRYRNLKKSLVKQLDVGMIEFSIAGR